MIFGPPKGGGSFFHHFGPPPLPPPSLKSSKMWVSSGGDWGGSEQKTHWGMRLCGQNNDVTRGEPNDSTLGGRVRE